MAMSRHHGGALTDKLCVCAAAQFPYKTQKATFVRMLRPWQCTNFLAQLASHLQHHASHQLCLVQTLQAQTSSKAQLHLSAPHHGDHLVFSFWNTGKWRHFIGIWIFDNVKMEQIKPFTISHKFWMPEQLLPAHRHNVMKPQLIPWPVNCYF